MSWKAMLDKLAADYLPDMKLVCDEPMSRHTSFRIGGPAARMAFPVNAEQVVLLQGLAEDCGIRPLVIGNGTNLLVSDAGIDNLLIDTSEMNTIHMEEDGVTVTAYAGVSLARLADFACKQGLTGLEFAHGIPGTLGGAVCMNAGAYGGEMKDVVTRVTAFAMDGSPVAFDGEEMQFGYRRSVLNQSAEIAAVTSVTVALHPGDEETIRATMREFSARRREKQPITLPSCGSTFKRPEGQFAGTLIDQCGLKGLRVGGASVSTLHAGFLVNDGEGTAADYLGLIAEVQRIVYEKTGTRLEPEVRIIGEDTPLSAV